MSDEGAFEIKDLGLDDFNIEPRADLRQPIPPGQRELQHEIYRTHGTLKLLAEQGVFGKRPRLLRWRALWNRSKAPEGAGDAGTQQPAEEGEKDRMLKEFRTRLLQIAKTGLTGSFVQMEQAVEAHQDLRRELLTRKGNTVKYHYLAILACWAAIGLLVGFAVYILSPWTGAKAYGLLVMGAVVGAWLSVASTRWSVAFEDLPDFLDSRVEPAVRILFVVVLVCAVGVALQAKLLQIRLGGVDLATFIDSAPVALLFGLVTGVSERALATRFIESARTLATK
jgi:hypothetical protein